MAYATGQDIIERHGADILYVCADRDGDDVLDASVIANALDDASAEMDVYLGKRYPLPLLTVPTVLVALCANMALYFMARKNPAALTDELRQGYEDASKLLGKIASGEVTLGIVVDQDNDGEPDGSGTAEVISNPREYNRNSMGRLT